MDGQSIRATIERFWDARLASDKQAALSVMSERATYEMVGAKALAADIVVGRTEAGVAADGLFDDFAFKDLDMRSVIVEGRKAAVECKIQVSFRGGPFATTEFCDVWEFDDAGKVTSLRQFVDSHFLGKMIATQVKDS
jgi:ketosteroid isomerase-like protein